jgi:hypothetical protein
LWSDFGKRLHLNAGYAGTGRMPVGQSLFPRKLR